MEDKRIIKTKQNLKQTMIGLLARFPFERVTVCELCRAGMTSRITFYTHYDDKYALVEDMFCGYIGEAVRTTTDCRRKTIPPSREALQGYYNMLDCILNLYYNNLAFFCGPPRKETRTYTPLFTTIFSAMSTNISEGTAIRWHQTILRANCRALVQRPVGCYQRMLCEAERRGRTYARISVPCSTTSWFRPFFLRKTSCERAGRKTKGRPMAALFVVWHRSFVRAGSGLFLSL